MSCRNDVITTKPQTSNPSKPRRRTSTTSSRHPSILNMPSFPSTYAICSTKCPTLSTLRNTPALHPLLPYYRLLYDGPNTCWYKPAHDSTHQYFLQHEGHAQGDPLSGAFSSIPLALLLDQIRPQLIQRQQQQQSLTNPTTPQPLLHAPRCYMDDTSVLLHHEDISWFINQFLQHGPQFGIHLNLTKTQLLTATDHSPTHTTTHPHPNPHIRQALHLLTSSDSHPTTR